MRVCWFVSEKVFERHGEYTLPQRGFARKLKSKGVDEEGGGEEGMGSLVPRRDIRVAKRFSDLKMG